MESINEYSLRDQQLSRKILVVTSISYYNEKFCSKLTSKSLKSEYLEELTV